MGVTDSGQLRRGGVIEREVQEGNEGRLVPHESEGDGGLEASGVSEGADGERRVEQLPQEKVGGEREEWG